MRIPAFTELICKWYGNRSKPYPSLFLLGPPGIGKSQVVEDAARSIAAASNKVFVKFEKTYGLKGWELGGGVTMREIMDNPAKYFLFVDLRLIECEPSDLSGFPSKINGEYAVYDPLDWAVLLSRCAGILFLDELTNVNRPDVITCAFKITRDRMTGFVKFGDDVLVIAAGNDPEHSSVATMLPTPLVDRIRILTAEGPTVDEWDVFMSTRYGDKWSKTTYAFLKAFEAENYLLRVPKESETLSNFPTHRSWTELALSMTCGFDDKEMIMSHVGAEVGQRFHAFLSTEIPPIEEIIKRPKTFKEFAKEKTGDIDKQYMTLFMLATWVSKSPKSIVADCLPLVDTIMDVQKELVLLLLKMVPLDSRKILMEVFESAGRKHIIDFAYKIISEMAS